MQRQQEEGAPLCPHPTCPTHDTRIATSSHKPGADVPGPAWPAAGDPIRPHRPHRAERCRHPPAVIAGGSFIPGGHQEEKLAPSPRMTLRCGAVGQGGCPRRRHGVPRSPRTPAALSAPHTARRARGVARGIRRAVPNRGRRFVNPRRAESCKSRTAASPGSAPHRPASPQPHSAAAPEPGGRPLPHRASAFCLFLFTKSGSKLFSSCGSREKAAF